MKIVYFDFVNDKGAVTKKEFDNIIKNLEGELLPYVVEVRFKSFGTSAFKNIIIKSK